MLPFVLPVEIRYPISFLSIVITEVVDGSDKFKVSPHIKWGSVGSKPMSTGHREPRHPQHCLGDAASFVNLPAFDIVRASS